MVSFDGHFLMMMWRNHKFFGDIRIFHAPVVNLGRTSRGLFICRISFVFLMSSNPPCFVMWACSHLIRLVQALLRFIILNLIDLLSSCIVVTVHIVRLLFTVEIVPSINFLVIDRLVAILRRNMICLRELLMSLKVLTPLVGFTSVRILIHI